MEYKKKFLFKNIYINKSNFVLFQILELLRSKLNKKSNNYIFICTRIIFNRFDKLIKIFLLNFPGNYKIHEIYNPIRENSISSKITKNNLKRFFSDKAQHKLILDKYKRTIEFNGNIYTLNNANIDTNTNLIKKEKEIFKSPFSLKDELTNAEYSGKVKYLKDKIQVIKSRKKKIYFDDAYIINCECSTNWSHFLLGIFTTLIEFISSNGIKNSTFIIPSIPHKNGLNLISDFVNYLDPDNTNKFLFFDPGFYVYVKKLIYIDCCCYHPYGFKKGIKDIKILLFFDRVRLSKAKKIVDNFLLINNFPEKDRKIYLERSGNFRNAINKLALRDCLKNLEFEVFNPEYLSLKEQYKTFSNCSHLVSTSGAALSNMIFMKVGSKVTVIMAKSEYVSYGHWQSQAYSYGLHLNFCLGEMPDDQLTEIHPSFYIDLKLVEKTINE